MEQPVLETPRLLLRPFVLADAADVQRLAGAPEVADTTLNLPHPYREGVAEAWIGSHASRFAEGGGVNYAITFRADGALMGSISLIVTRQHRRAELGYWLGVPFWGQGYMTEAAGALVARGFALLDLHKIEATHMTRNPASGRVMEKVGMTLEGLLREHVFKNGGLEDLAVYGILESGRAVETAPTRSQSPPSWTQTPV